MNKIVKNIIILILISLIVLCVSCKSDDSISFDVNPTTINIDFLGGVSTINVVAKSNSFTSYSNKDWCLVSNKGNTVSVTISQNNTGIVRSAMVLIKSDVKTIIVTINQSYDTPTAKDSLALLKFKSLSTDITWISTKSMENWDGVKIEIVDNMRRVTELDLHAKSLLGTIPVEIKDLNKLEYLDLSDNTLSGSIPDISSLSGLLVLDISKNKITGSLPNEISSLHSLIYLSLGQNKITGTLPSQYNSLTALRVLDLGMNQLTDVIPSGWSTMSSLRYLYLYGNAFTGTIPSYFAGFNKLINLSLEYNNFTENIPVGLGSISSLTSLTMSKNRFSGAVPADLLSNTYWNIWKPEIMNQQPGYVLTVPAGVGSKNKVKSVLNSNIGLIPHILPDKKDFYQH